MAILKNLNVNGVVELNNNDFCNSVLSNYSEKMVTIESSGTSCTLDCGISNLFNVTVTDNCQIEFSNFTHPDAVKEFVLIINNSGNYDLIWPSEVYWQTDILPDTNGILIVKFISVNSGASIFAVPMGQSYEKKSYSVNISTDINNLDLKTAAMDSGWNGVKPVVLTFTIDNGVTVGSTSTSAAAMTTGDLKNSFVRLINYGRIIGKGGAGGAGGSVSGNTPGNGSNGLDGGPALSVTSQISIYNHGEIYGGGGGGAGGGGLWDSITETIDMSDSIIHNYAAGGGGGGAGIGSTVSAGGAGSTADTTDGDNNYNAPGSAGTGSSIESAGIGGQGGAATGNGNTGNGGSGGNGGSFGSDGMVGADGTGSDNCIKGLNGSAGLAGYYVQGNSLVSWRVEGTCAGRAS